MIQKNSCLTVSKTAQLLKTTKVNVLMHIRKGLLGQVEIEGEWYVPIDSFESFVSQNGIRKSDSVCSSGCGQHAGCSSSCG